MATQRTIRVTVCQIDANPNRLADDWRGLIAHVKDNHSQIVLLPEMPFSVWFAATNTVDREVWMRAVDSHQQWVGRFHELGVDIVAGSMPVNRDNTCLNVGFIWTAASGLKLVHPKYYLPDEDGFWEATWYSRASNDFEVSEVNGIKVGFQICTELWFMEHSRAYAKAGVHLLLCPRSTMASTVDKWITGGRAAAIISGAYCLSSNHTGTAGEVELGGTGWIIDPEGTVLSTTSDENPFCSHDIDLMVAEQAKLTYPRYVVE